VRVLIGKNIMQNLKLTSLLVVFALLMPIQAHAEFIVSNAILEFTSETPTQQDIEIINRSGDNDYVDTEIRQIVHPGQPDQSKELISNPADAGILVTPNKTILAAGNRKVMRFVLLKKLDNAEHTYFVAVKPVIKGAESTSKLGLKILVGYEVLVIVRPAEMKPSETLTRAGKMLTVENTGNTSLLLREGRQCSSVTSCTQLPVRRIYPGEKASIELPADLPLTYSIWDGKDTIEKHLD
jgi:P pilus assembly chaperone PapD